MLREPDLVLFGSVRTIRPHFGCQNIPPEKVGKLRPVIAAGIGHGEGPDEAMGAVGHNVGFVTEGGNRSVDLPLWGPVLLATVFDGPPSIGILLRRTLWGVPDLLPSLI